MLPLDTQIEVQGLEGSHNNNISRTEIEKRKKELESHHNSVSAYVRHLYNTTSSIHSLFLLTLKLSFRLMRTVYSTVILAEQFLTWS